MKNPAADRILELDGLRAFMVMFVVLYHMTDFAGSLARGPGWIGNVISCLGPTGVHIFFIISGFIITTSYSTKELLRIIFRSNPLYPTLFPDCAPFCYVPYCLAHAGCNWRHLDFASKRVVERLVP
jgi:Acyltransferase family